MTIGHVIIAIQWASLAGGDHDTLFRPNLHTMFELKGETDNIV